MGVRVMRTIVDMDTVQIEITNACPINCSNCTRFCGHQKPYFMSLNLVEQCLQSMKDYPKMIGIMGGEPLLHPKFEQICKMAGQHFEPRQLGLWTSLPEGKEKYRNVICETFGHIFVNDHSRDDIYHAPILVASEDIVPDMRDLMFIADKCWLQNAWSACMNPKGAWFCEIAGALSILLDGPEGWPIEHKWWLKTPLYFRSQAEWACPKCGVCLPLPRRASIEHVDDISKSNYERLKNRSLKIKRGEYILHDKPQLTKEPEQMAAYKDSVWRQGVADRYGIYLYLNEQGFQTPILRKEFNNASKQEENQESLSRQCG
jgi:hypothetical protein